MHSCEHLYCLCCYPYNQREKTQSWPVIDFMSSSTHRFLNGYTTYLNCPATYNTTNVIYSMAYPCGEYDYIDSTSKILPHAMAFHRENGHRIIHEKLTGSALYPEVLFDSYEQQNERMKQMRLYQLSARCPVVLRTFLDCNPSYWCLFHYVGMMQKKTI